MKLQILEKSGVTSKRRRVAAFVSVGLILTFAACSGSNFTSDGSKPSTNSKRQNPKSGATGSDGSNANGPDGSNVNDPDGTSNSNSNTGANPPGASNADTLVLETDNGSINTKRCSAVLDIPASSNPYLAGAASGTSINYATGNQYAGTDVAPAQSPVLITMSSADCLAAGARLYFDVSGEITHGGGGAKSNADGTTSSTTNFSFVSHMKGSIRGLSNVTAPINSMVAVFLDDSAPDNLPAPSELNFTSDTARNASEFKPQLRQVFFIGDGKTTTGVSQRVIVPAGAKRLYMGVMDIYVWSNNAGALKGGVTIEATP